MRRVIMSAIVFALASVLPTAAREPIASSPLISAESLQELIQNKTPELVVIDIRSPELFQSGHLPNAIRLDVGSWKKLMANEGALRDAASWSAAIRALGISKNSRVVVYGEPITDAARAWWVLRYVGVESAQLLDGGVSAWRGINGPLTTAPTSAVSLGDFEAHFDERRYATADEIQRLGVESKQCQIVDNRTEAEYLGKDVRGARGGHIPSAKNLDWQAFVDERGKFHSVDQLKEIMTKRGIALDQPVATHCQSGGRSSVGALAFELATGKPTKNYYGSWGDWSARSELPVETKAADSK